MNEFDSLPDENVPPSDNAPSDSWISAYEPPSMGCENVVNYYFPVQIVVSGGLTPADHETLQANVMQDLYDAINRRILI